MLIQNSRRAEAERREKFEEAATQKSKVFVADFRLVCTWLDL